MPKIPQTAYTIVFALLFAVTAFFLWNLNKSHRALKESVEVLEQGLKDEIEQLSGKTQQLESDYVTLENTDSEIRAYVDEIRKMKADKQKKRDEEKAAVDTFTADSLYRILARRYAR